MSLAFYLDENVNRAIAVGLRLRDVDVLTVQEDGQAGLADPEVLDRATELGRVLFSQDTDLLAEAQKHQVEGRTFAGVVFVHQQRLTLGACITDLEMLAKAAEAEELHGVVVYLPL